MLPILSFFALLPLALALRVPADLDATATLPEVKVDLTHALANGLDLGAAASAINPRGITLAKRANPLLPNIQAGASFCVTLTSAVAVTAPGTTTVNLAAGTCLCFDANAATSGGINDGFVVVASSGQIFTGAAAARLQTSVRLPHAPSSPFQPPTTLFAVLPSLAVKQGWN